ncbi:MAG: hypothetical protein KDE27_16360 [Planctomycetes bacterium]|nr:hypothetical protein [Planctomycetota bacterium]
MRKVWILISAAIFAMFGASEAKAASSQLNSLEIAKGGEKSGGNQTCAVAPGNEGAGNTTCAVMPGNGNTTCGATAADSDSAE